MRLASGKSYKSFCQQTAEKMVGVSADERHLFLRRKWNNAFGTISGIAESAKNFNRCKPLAKSYLFFSCGKMSRSIIMAYQSQVWLFTKEKGYPANSRVILYWKVLSSCFHYVSCGNVAHGGWANYSPMWRVTAWAAWTPLLVKKLTARKQAFFLFFPASDQRKRTAPPPLSALTWSFYLLRKKKVTL